MSHIRSHIRNHIRSHIRGITAGAGSTPDVFMTTLKAGSSEHYTIPTITFTGDFNVKFEASIDSFSAASMVLSGGTGTDGMELGFSVAGQLELYFEGSLDTDFFTNNYSDARLHTFEISRTGTTVSVIADGITSSKTITVSGSVHFDIIGRRLAASLYHSGIVRNFEFFDAGSMINRYKVDEDWAGPSTVLVDSVGTDDGTAVNITTADGQNYVFNSIPTPKTWTGTDSTVVDVAVPDSNPNIGMVVATTGASEMFTIPCQNSGVFDATIDWGDASESTITAYNDADLVHTYASAGDHTITITGTFGNIYYNNGGDKAKVKEVSGSGYLGMLATNASFFGCTAMTLFDGMSDTKNSVSFADTFRSCTALTSLDASTLDTTLTTTMARTFFSCSALTTLDISTLNFSIVTSFASTFSGCLSITSLLMGSIDTSSCISFGNAFRDCSSLPTLDISMLDTSITTNFEDMFRGCSSLTLLDVSTLDISVATNLSDMFNGAASDVIIGISTFDIGAVTNLTSFLVSSSITTAEYDATLIAWDALTVTSGLTADFGTSTYTAAGAAATARASLISSDLWTINDGGTA